MSREAGVPSHHSADGQQDVMDAANCGRLDAKGGRESRDECVKRSQNGVVSDRGGNAKVNVLLQSWSERLRRHSEVSDHPRSREMDSPATRHRHSVDEPTRLQFRSPSTTAPNGAGRPFNVESSFDASNDDPLGKTPAPNSSPPPTTPPTPTGDWVPTFVVSDCSGTTWPEPWSELLGGGGGGLGGGGRRLSAVSDCSTVSSIGWDRSRRGSLLDLDAEGLQLDSNGRLERADRSGTTEPPDDIPQSVTQPRDHDTFRKIFEPRTDRSAPAAVASGQQRSEETSRKISSWSYSSVSTLSQDDEEDLLGTTPTPSAPVIAKVSECRADRGIVMMTVGRGQR